MYLKIWLLICLLPIAELFIRGKKLSISLIFIRQSYFSVPKNIRLNSTHYFIMKISNTWELQQNAFNHSSGTDLQDFMHLYKKCTAKLYLFLVIDTTLASDGLLPFRKNIKTNHDNQTKNYSTILTEKQQKYQHYYLEKLIMWLSYRSGNVTFQSKTNNRTS